MAKIVWDQTGTRNYETGVDHGVLYKYAEAAGQEAAGFKNGVAWNGLTAVNESPSGAEPSPLYADNIKYLNLMSAEEYAASIEAYTYPDEFEECDGSAEIATGVLIGQQPRKLFAFCYRTLIGDDVQGTDKGYKLHLIYNCLASPSERAHSTVNDSPEATTLSWEVSTTPVEVPGYKPTASVTIDSTKVSAAALEALEAILYGDTNNAPRMPYPAELTEIFGGEGTAGISLNVHTLKMTTTGGTKTLTATTTPAGSTVTWTSGSDSVATVADGVVTPVGAGNTIITASITEDGVTYNDTCTVIVASGS